MVVSMPASRVGSRKRRSTAPLTLRQVRERLGVSQGELARALNSSQPAVLKTESSPDLRLSTVERFIEGLGRVAGRRAEVRLVALIGDEEQAIAMPAETETEAGPQTDNSAWRLRAWDDPVLEATWLEEGVVSMSKDEIGDLTTWPGDEQVARRLTEALPERSDQAIGTFVTYWRYFAREMEVDDIVVTPMSGKRAGVARITGDYRYNEGATDARLRHVRPVEWLKVVQRADLDEDIRRVVNAPGTLCRIGAPDAAARLS